MNSKQIFLFLPLIFACSLAQAHKDVSGGNGDGGTLLDRGIYAEAKELDPFDILTLLKREKHSIFERYPLLSNIAGEMITSKSWYLESREFAKECRNQILLTSDQEVWACQNDIEVRLNSNWWSHATDQVKTDLVLHEVFVNFWLAGDDVKSINSVVESLLTLKDSRDIQTKLAQAHLFLLPTAQEIEAHLNVLNAFAKGLATQPSTFAASRYLSDFGLSTNGAAYTEASYLDPLSGYYMYCSLAPYKHWLEPQAVYEAIWKTYQLNYQAFWPQKKKILDCDREADPDAGR